MDLDFLALLDHFGPNVVQNHLAPHIQTCHSLAFGVPVSTAPTDPGWQSCLSSTLERSQTSRGFNLPADRIGIERTDLGGHGVVGQLITE